MSTILSPVSDFNSNINGEIRRVDWKYEDPPPREFEAIVCPEEEGGYSVFALNYPGVISQGDTLDEAKANIAEAFIGMLEARRKHGEDMQFSSSQPLDLPAGSKRVRIKVDG